MDHNCKLFWQIMVIKLSLKSHLAIPKAQAEMGLYYFVKQMALNSVTEQVGYGCLANLLSSPLCMDSQLKEGSLFLRWCKNYKIKPKKTNMPPLFCICNVRTIPNEEDFSIHMLISYQLLGKKHEGKQKKNTLREKVYQVKKPS